MTAALAAVLIGSAHARAGGPTLYCCEDFAGGPTGGPDGQVDISDLLALFASWGPCGEPEPNADIAPHDGNCTVGNDGQADVSDLLALLAAWGPCNSFRGFELCAYAAHPDVDARITEDGQYPFELAGRLDGPQRGPTNDLSEILSGPTTCDWIYYGPDNILGQYQYGDLFGIDMRTDPFTKGGDAWFHYTAMRFGTALFETTASCPTGPVTVDDTVIEVYPGDSCPVDWRQVLNCFDEGRTLSPCGNHARAFVHVLPGEPYLIRIGGWAAEQGAATLHVSCVDNSVFEQAIDLALNAPLTGSTIGAPIAVAPACDGVEVDTPGRWYRFVGDGRTFVASTCGSQIDFATRLSIYTSTDGTAARLVCLTLVDSDTCGLGESVAWATTAGTTYYLLVHGASGAPPPFVSEGTFVIEVERP